MSCVTIAIDVCYLPSGDVEVRLSFVCLRNMAIAQEFRVLAKASHPDNNSFRLLSILRSKIKGIEQHLLGNDVLRGICSPSSLMVQG